jgi:hypothetical protein
LQVDDELELDRPQNWQVGGLLAFERAADIGADLAKLIRQARSIAFDRALAAALAIATSQFRDNSTGAPVWTGCGRCRKMTWCKQRLLPKEKKNHEQKTALGVDRG